MRQEKSGKRTDYEEREGCVKKSEVHRGGDGRSCRKQGKTLSKREETSSISPRRKGFCWGCICMKRATRRVVDFHTENAAIAGAKKTRGGKLKLGNRSEHRRVKFDLERIVATGWRHKGQGPNVNEVGKTIEERLKETGERTVSLSSKYALQKKKK